jgi:hypothetical protein
MSKYRKSKKPRSKRSRKSRKPRSKKSKKPRSKRSKRSKKSRKPRSKKSKKSKKSRKPRSKKSRKYRDNGKKSIAEVERELRGSRIRKNIPNYDTLIRVLNKTGYDKKEGKSLDEFEKDWLLKKNKKIIENANKILGSYNVPVTISTNSRDIWKRTKAEAKAKAEAEEAGLWKLDKERKWTDVKPLIMKAEEKPTEALTEAKIFEMVYGKMNPRIEENLLKALNKYLRK